jgi:hypothetical protein
MPRSPASITQANIARAIRAAKKSGAAELAGHDRWLILERLYFTMYGVGERLA